MKKLLQKMIFLMAFLVGTAVMYGQGSIRGMVSDAKGDPVAGANVYIVGTTIGTSTSVDGKFQIGNVPPGNIKIEVSFVGYTTVTQDITITSGKETELNVKLMEDNQQLSELVVIGYGTAKKKELTGSIAVVGEKDFQKGAIVSPEQLVMGKVAGVVVTQNGGAPGSGSNIRIRGGSSLNASNDPLIVVDGVPLASPKANDGKSAIGGVADPMSLINPNDIETFTILKDASATAIYGSRASNGVILITTKKGRSNKPTVSLGTQLIVSTLTKKVDVLSSSQFRDYVNANGTDANKQLVGQANTNWQDEIYHTGIGSNTNLSVGGVMKNLPYRVSLGYLNQNGLLITDNVQRFSGSINLNPTFFDNHLKVDINLKGTSQKSVFANTTSIGAAATFDPTQPVTDGADKFKPFGGYYEWTNPDGTLNPNGTKNPVSLIRTKNDEGTVNRSIGNVQFDYSFHFLPELHANLNLGYDVARGKGTVNIDSLAAQEYNNRGLKSQYNNTFTNKVLEFYLNYNKDLGSIKSNINLTAGYGYYDNLKTENFFAKLNQRNDTIAGSQPVFPFDKPRNTLISYYGRLIYTYDSKYILAASLRTDGSSRFSKENRWGVFPSVAFTWRINQENFLKDNSVLSDLKLRLSYGETGNQDGIDLYSYLPVYEQSTNASLYQIGNKFYYLYAPNAYDANIKWEQTATTNLGIDYGFLNNRLYGSVDFYIKKTKDLLNKISVPVGSNFSNQVLTNVGNIDNKGVEFMIGAGLIRRDNFSWDASFNVAYNHIEITNLTASKDTSFIGNLTGGINGATGQNIQINSVGYAPKSFFVFKQVYDQSGKPIEGAYVDLNGDGLINEKDQYRYKSPAPRMTFGFSTQVAYKRFSVNLSLRANTGNYIYDNVSSNLGVRRNILNPLNYLQNATTDIYNTNFYNNQFQSDYYIKNASFLRMDNIGIGYNVGGIFNNKASLRLSLNCQNVFVVTKYKGLDPEIFDGIDNNFYPRPRNIILGVNVDF